MLSASQLRALLHSSAAFDFVFVNSCESETVLQQLCLDNAASPLDDRDPRDTNASSGFRLGVGWRGVVASPSCAAMAATFYQALHRGVPVERAFTEANAAACSNYAAIKAHFDRSAVLTGDARCSVATPVLCYSAAGVPM